jgi:hypothetical protein
MPTLSPQAFESPTGKKKIEIQVNENKERFDFRKESKRTTVKKVCGWQNDARRDMLKCGPKDDS